MRDVSIGFLDLEENTKHANIHQTEKGMVFDPFGV
jgi:hypothetical protein